MLNKKDFFIHRFYSGINPVILNLSNIIFIFKSLSVREKYFLFLAKLYKPNFFVTTFDNDIFFYSLKKLTNIQTCIIQNGYRSYNIDAFNKLEKINCNGFLVDYKFLFGPSIASYYDKFVSGKNIYLGSFKNNLVEKSSNIISKKSIGYISQFRNFKTQGSLPDLDVLEFLNKYCKKNNLQLNIYMLGSKKVFGRASLILKDEIEFYDKNISCKKKYFFRNHSLENIDLLDKEEIMITIDSTLGYEMLARKKKIIFFSIRDSNNKYIYYCDRGSHKFGWPSHYPDKGICWSNLYDEKIFEEILKNAKNEPIKMWEKKSVHFQTIL